MTATQHEVEFSEECLTLLADIKVEFRQRTGKDLPLEAIIQLGIEALRSVFDGNDSADLSAILLKEFCGKRKL